MLNLFQNDSESGMIPFPEYFIRNLYVHRFRLSSRSADTRRRIVRWLFLHFHVYDYHPADAETTGRMGVKTKCVKIEDSIKRVKPM